MAAEQTQDVAGEQCDQRHDHIGGTTPAVVVAR